MKNKIVASFAITIFSLPITFSCNSSNNKVCKIAKENYKRYVYLNTNVDDYIAMPVNLMKNEVETITIGDVDTYRFKDIDYSIDYLRSSWPAANHLSRTLKIAIVAEERNSNEVRNIAKKLTYHWVFSNYHNINWWQNELGANSTLANIGLFTFDYLDKKGQDAFNGKIRESSLKYRPSIATHTGANMIDYIDITCRNAAINNDKEEMDIAFNRLKEEISNDKIEGFQEDGSFFQHGRQVQNVSYGKCIIRIAKTLYNLRGTGYILPNDKMQILSDYVLNGLRFSTFKGYTNYTTVSREFSRPNNLDTQSNGFGELSYFLGIDNYPKKEETYRFINSLKYRNNALSGDKVQYFYIAKMIVANIDGVYMSYKATEPNLTNTECVNGENRLGLNLSYGTNTCVMDKGTEYFNIAPIMDYNFMPGTSSITYKDNSGVLSNDSMIIKYAESVYKDQFYEHKVPEATSINGYIYNDGENEDITFSMTKTMHHERGGYTVTCFATNDGMVLVGSNLSYSKQTGDPDDISTEDMKIHTTVDQYITDDDTQASTAAKSFTTHHEGNVTYTSLDTKNLNKKIETRTINKEDWKRNNRDFNPSSDTPIGDKNVATITIDTSLDNSYAYSIQPTKRVSEKKFTLISKANDIHAIKLPNDKIVAAFYNKNNDSFTYDGKTYKLTNKFETGKGAFEIFDKQ